jgi:3-hydroxyisobutyrate dehydrogenase-like beta-hydroxyacid dehydrogenase
LAPYLDAVGLRGVTVGRTGNAQRIRHIEALIAAVTLQAACEGLRVGLAGGLALDRLMEVLKAGSGDSTMLRAVAALVGEGDRMQDFSPWSTALDAALAEAHAQGAGLPAASLTRALVAERVRAGDPLVAAVVRHA